MRCEGFVSALAVLVSLMFLMVILSQREVTKTLNKNEDTIKTGAERLYNDLQMEEQTKVDLEKVFTLGQRSVDDQQAALTELTRQMEAKRPESEACQTETKTQKDELDVLQKQYTETQAALQVESESWNKEITTLKEQLTMYREICNYVRKDPLVEGICGAKPG